ncbi:ADP-ribosylglycohydrolase family protein [Fuerstiella marisgermanici]|uniref:ADP-ribosyl-[dinitrogen reductase] hydrolase n=1 Tax=Fuerstiella marisgermanici TaxID=1891926 RepID=A0A1P8WH46_9PLAN|nr:ADP-ribosylglycohydrolase family protein [Fuerstiella marisgermanici]APZ93365.1 ADP-ribosyl-[dinitrogen reductase] hydrolase [Fuerstiella marisgermanici]
MTEDRLGRACLSLDGLSIGDAFGQQFFSPNVAAESKRSNPPTPPWNYTDDTEMAIALTETLRVCESVDQEFFVQQLVERYQSEPNRGYGAGARRLLEDVAEGGCWKTLSQQMFSGSGSHGNGAAMRVSPLVAWFADDIDLTIKQAALSAEVTHTHPEAIVGAIAVALSSGWAWRRRSEQPEELIPWVISKLDQSEVRRRLEWVATYPLDTWAYTIASQVGCGDEISSQDTVPFCLWMAAAHLNDYSEAMWTAARVGGDMDTTCAIIGGIVAMSVGSEGIPADWKLNREPLGWSSRPN